MNSQIVVLQGGEDVKKRTNESLIKKIGKLSVTKKILIIPWTTNSIEEEKKYRGIYENYFSDNGFEEVRFLERESAEQEIDEGFAGLDVVYLPGGDTEVLYHELKMRSIGEKLRRFNGIILGNSAGAIILSKGMHRDGKFYPGFGLVDFFVTVHFKIEEESLCEESYKPTINIPEDMWVSIFNNNSK